MLAEDVVDASGERMYRAGNGVGCIMADDAAAGTVLLVGDVHGGSGSCRESREVCSVGNDGVVSGEEGHITHSELLCPSVDFAAMAGVFADAQQIIEGNCAHVADGLYFGRQGRETLLEQKGDQADRDGEFVLGRGSCCRKPSICHSRGSQ